ncbi:MAG: glycoside hydrolase, partial [Halothece sp. Uz-M2-17]|nr:glycoside hydrolase [Halothece sp. Uz-M2-17]
MTQVDETNQLETQTEVCVTVHGHFYQPPRENPYLEAVERQPSAEPFHDWNERIHHQCYRPNVFARVLNEQGEVIDIVNNFEYLSFNVGPTLMSWLEGYDLEVYQKIIEADRAS